jgi:hypothetical protein
LKAYAAQWEKVQVGQSTLSVTDNAVRLHINPELGDRRIGSIRQSDIQGLVKTLEGKELAAGTVRNIYDTAARIFASAVDDRVIPSSPCHRIKLPKDDKGEIVPSEYAKAAKAAGLDLIGWSLERDGPLNKGGGFYHASVKAAIDRDGDTLTVLDVLAKQVGVRAMFSDWPATTTFYANCMGKK